MINLLKERYLNRDFLNRYLWRIICTVLALIIGILLITIGFFKTLLLAIVIAIGYFIGQSKDRGINIVEYIRTLLS